MLPFHPDSLLRFRICPSPHGGEGRKRPDVMQNAVSRLPDELPDLPAELSRRLRQIPAGRVTTYGELARSLGDVGAARWVGEYLVDHPHDDECRCHRVVRKGGEVGLYITGETAEKIARLQSEGIAVVDGRAALSDQFTGFVGPAPLQRLRDQQERLHQLVRLCPIEQTVHTVAGIDVSFVSPEFGVAAYVKIDAASHEVLWSTTVARPVAFPYVSNYLTFRELPLYMALFDEVRNHGEEADVVLVDGNGILHPRRAGSASACGVAVEMPTIGIGKKLLCGQVRIDDLPVRQPRDVMQDGERIGFAMKAGERNRPFFASPGHRVDLPSAITIVMQSLGTGRLPVPIALADRISRDEARRMKSSLNQDD